MDEYIYLIAGICLGVAFFVGLYIFQRRRSEKQMGHSWISYLLVWPVILDADKGRRDGRFLTKRDGIGWGIVALIVVLAVVFTPSRRGG
jgi:hypothetical protein